MKRTQMLVLPVVAAVLVLSNVQSAQCQEDAEKVAAVVNGEKIMLTEIQKLLKRDTPPIHPLTREQKREMYQMAMDMLVNDILMRQFLAKNAAPADPNEVNKEIAGLKEALAAKKTTFSKFLEDTMQTEEQLKEEIVARIQWRNYVQRRIPDDLVKKYYDKNKVFFDKIFVRASHILMKTGEKATPEEKLEIQKKLVAIKANIEAKTISFAEAAKKYSDCPSAKQEGDIGHFPYKFAVADSFAEAAFALKVGQISQPVETGFGYHLILVTDRTKGEPSDFNQIKDVVRDVYAQEVQLHQNIIDEQRKASQVRVLVDY